MADAFGGEAAVRLIAFFAVFGVMTVWEVLAPRRVRTVARVRRWPGNLGILLIDILAVRLVFRTAAVGVAFYGEARGWGLFNNVAVPYWAAVILSVLLLDLAIYAQHVVFHHVPALWRLHRMHHADLDFDATTALRFHPFEILLSMGIKAALVLLLGAPALAVLIFEVLLNATAMFNHGNVRMPAGLDRVVRWFLVTPDMHRVHHSVVKAETDSNFGFNLPWWDRLFGTYRDQPQAGHTGMTIGIDRFRDPAELRFDRLLTQPFREG